MVLVSCAGKASDRASEAELQKVVEFKRRGEDILRLSGLGYTIIRPGGQEVTYSGSTLHLITYQRTHSWAHTNPKLPPSPSPQAP